ncbi:MAG: AsmA family protein [Elusimicrobiales bacterium]
MIPRISGANIAPLRRLAFTAAIIAGAVIAAMITVRLIFPSAKLKAWTTSWLARKINREFRMEDVHASLGGISIKNLAISEAGGFDNGEMLTAKSVSVSFRLGALLRKKISVRSIDVDGVMVNIAKTPDGRFNFSDISGDGESPQSAPAQQNAKSGGASDYDFEADRLSIRNTDIYFRSRTGNIAQIKDLSFYTNDISFAQPFEAASECHINFIVGDNPVTVYVKTNSQLDLTARKISEYKLTVRSVLASWEKLSLTGSARVSDFSAPHGIFKFRIAPLSSTQLQQVLSNFPAHIPLPETAVSSSFAFENGNLSFSGVQVDAGPLSASGGFMMGLEQTSAWALNAAVKTKLPEMNTSSLARLARALPRGWVIPESETSFNISAAPGSAKITECIVSAGSLNFKGIVNLDLRPEGWAGSAAGNFRGDMSEISKIAPGYAKYRLRGKMGGRLSAAWVPPSAMTYSGSAVVADGGLVFGQSRISDMEVSAQFTQDSVSVQKAAGKLDGAAFTAAFSTRTSPRLVKAKISASLGAVNLVSLIPKTEAPEPAEGKGQAAPPETAYDIEADIKTARLYHPAINAGAAEFKCALTGITAKLDKARGKASFCVHGGRLGDIASFAVGNRFANALLMPLMQIQRGTAAMKFPFLPELDNLSFSNMEGEYDFRDGRMSIAKTVLDTGVAQLSSWGGVDFTAREVDIKTRIKLSGKLARYGEPVLAITGDMHRPSVKLDAQALGDTLINAGKNALKGLFK